MNARETVAALASSLRAIDDVPLVAGLTEKPEPVVFESDQGRVVHQGPAHLLQAQPELLDHLLGVARERTATKG